MRTQLLASKLEIDIWDKDTFSKDEWLGSTELSLTALTERTSRRLSTGIAEHEFTHKLSTQGEVTFKVRMNEHIKLDKAFVSQFSTPDELEAQYEALQVRVSPDDVGTRALRSLWRVAPHPLACGTPPDLLPRLTRGPPHALVLGTSVEIPSGTGAAGLLSAARLQCGLGEGAGEGGGGITSGRPRRHF